MRVLVAGKARNEGLYLIDWVAWYTMAGFDRILIVANDNTDGSDDLLRALKQAGKIDYLNVSHVPLDGGAVGYRSVNALVQWPELKRYDHLLAVDLDEFLYMPGGTYLSNLKETLEHAHDLYLNMLDFASGYTLDYRDELVIDRNSYMGNPAGGKVFCKVDGLIEFTSAHHAKFSDSRARVRTDGRPARQGPLFDTAYLAHYPTKSVEEFVYRQCRGNAVVVPSVTREAELGRFKHNYRVFLKLDTKTNRREATLLTPAQRDQFSSVRQDILSNREVERAYAAVKTFYRQEKERTVVDSFLFQYVSGGFHEQNPRRQYDWARGRYEDGKLSHDLLLFLCDKASELGLRHEASQFAAHGLELYDSWPLRQLTEDLEATPLQAQYKRVTAGLRKKWRRLRDRS